MRDTIFQKFFGSLMEAVLLIQRTSINLRFDGDFICMEIRFRCMDGGLHDFAAQSAAALYRNHAPNRRRRKGYALRQYPCIRFNAIFIL